MRRGEGVLIGSVIKIQTRIEHCLGNKAAIGFKPERRKNSPAHKG